MLLSYHIIKSKVFVKYQSWQIDHQISIPWSFSPYHKRYEGNRQPHALSRALQYATDKEKKSPTSKRLKKFFADSPKIVIQLRGTFLLDSFPELESKNLIPPWRICSKDKECQNQTDLLDKRLMGKDHR